MEVVASLSQGRTAAAQCGLVTQKSVPVIFEPPCILKSIANETAIYHNPRLHSFTGDRKIHERSSIDQHLCMLSFLRKFEAKHFFMDTTFFDRRCVVIQLCNNGEISV